MPPKSGNKISPGPQGGGATSNYTPPAPSYLFEYVLQPCYAWIAAFYPPWITPNMITICGITSTVFASLIYFAFVMYPNTNDSVTGLPKGTGGLDKIYDLRFTTLEQYGQFNPRFNVQAAKEYSTPSLPSVAFNSVDPLGPGAIIFVHESLRWILIIVGLMNCWYMVCDNSDGIHARRYGMCSAIGEYLDHGMDSVVFPLSVFVLSTSLFERLNIAIFVQSFLALLTYMTHSVNYSTGIMIWGNRFVSVDEGTLLFSVGPLLVGLFDHMSERVFPFGGLRVVQVVYFVLVISQLDTTIKYIKADRGVLTNLGFLTHVAALVVMAFFGWFHRGGTTHDMELVFSGIHAKFTPLVDWDVSAMGAVPGFAIAIIKIGALFVRNVMTCYPALYGLGVAIITSILCHIAVSAKVLYLHTESWSPIGIVVAGLVLFAFHPPLSIIFMVIAHAWQIRANIVALLSPQHAQKVAEMKALSK